MRVVGIPFRVVPSRVEEIPAPGEAPRRFVRRAAREKDADEVFPWDVIAGGLPRRALRARYERIIRR